MAEPNRLRLVALMTEPRLVALPAADPLAAQTTIRLPDLAGRRLPNGSRADSGNVKSRHFCPTCGSPLYITFRAMPQFMAVHAGSLDDPRRYQAQAVTYAVRGLKWDRLDPALTAFEKMPPQG